jgi:hypothetical protein
VSFASAEGSQKIKRGMEAQAEEMISTLTDNLRGIYKGKLAEGESGVNVVKQLFASGLSKAVKRSGGDSIVGGIALSLEIEFGVARGKAWRPECAARGAKRLPRYCTLLFRLGKNKFSFLTVFLAGARGAKINFLF